TNAADLSLGPSDLVSIDDLISIADLTRANDLTVVHDLAPPPPDLFGIPLTLDMQKSSLSPFTVPPKGGGMSKPLNIATGDMDGDGFADLFTANNGEASLGILWGNGKGNFAASTHPLQGVGGNTCLGWGLAVG